MNLNELKQKWDRYNDEFDNSDYMDIEKHINMASYVGLLINEIERLNEYSGQLQHENQLLYGRLNRIRDLTNKEIQ